MKFRILKIENYKSFAMPTELQFPDVKDDRSVFLIGGMNGAGKTSVMEAIHYCLYGAKQEEILRSINRREFAKGNSYVCFELTMEMDDGKELIVKRSWTAGTNPEPRAKDLTEQLVVVHGGKRVSSQSKEIWQEFIRQAIPPEITQFFFFDGEKIQQIAADDHSEVKLRSSLESALGLQFVNQLIKDLNNIKQEEKSSFTDITDDDVNLKRSELKSEKGKLQKKLKEKEEITSDITDLKTQMTELRQRFEAAFHAEPESRETIRENERRRNKVASQLNTLDENILDLCEKHLPFALAGRIFDDIRNQIESERTSIGEEIIHERAADLAKRIVRAVEEPEPIYMERLSSEKMTELETRICRLLKEGDIAGVERILGLSERDAARVLSKMDTIEKSEVFSIMPMLEKKRELVAEKQRLDTLDSISFIADTDRDLFDQLQDEMNGVSTQIGRKTEQLRFLEEDILNLEKRIGAIETEIDSLFRSRDISKEKSDFIEEYTSIITVLSQYIVRLRKNKVHYLQEKTYEMYKNLSSKSDLIKDLIIDEKTFEVRISDRNGHEIKKSMLSAGEKEVFAISLLWGLAQTSQLTLPIIIDTPLSRLDSTHRDNIVNQYFPQAGEQVIILSTDTEIDTEYYRNLEPHLCGAARLEFTAKQELTTIVDGYFWKR